MSKIAPLGAINQVYEGALSAVIVAALGCRATRRLAKKYPKAKFEVVTRSEEAGFMAIPQRWVVERSIAWLS